MKLDEKAVTPMVYRVADLVDTPHLRVQVQAGAGGLDRQVAWAQTSDLE